MKGGFLNNEWEKIWIPVTAEYNKRIDACEMFENYEQLHDVTTPLLHPSSKLMRYGSEIFQLRLVVISMFQVITVRFKHPASCRFYFRMYKIR